MKNVKAALVWWFRRRRQERCLHAWTGDSPGWRCMWCDTAAPAGAFVDEHGNGVRYEGEGRP